jgi:hypothetical protein
LRCMRLVSRQSRAPTPRPGVVPAFRSRNALAQRFGDNGVGWLVFGENRLRRDPEQQYSPAWFFRESHRQFFQELRLVTRGSARGLCCAAEVSGRFPGTPPHGVVAKRWTLRGATLWKASGCSVTAKSSSLSWSPRGALAERKLSLSEYRVRLFTRTDL